MAGRERTSRRWGCLLSVGLTVGCATSAPTQRSQEAAAPSLPPQTLSNSDSQPSAPAPTPIPAPTPDPTVVVVESGGPPAEGNGLVAAARAERERRLAAGPPAVVLDDKNIREFAKDKKLTFANPAGAPAPQAGGSAAPGVTSVGTKSQESYWRERGLEIRRRWKGLAEELSQVRDRAGELRTKFYNTDDPYIRDSEVKPAWDRALDRIDAIGSEISHVREELERYQDEGQKAGATPAWLLEGIDLEPQDDGEPSRKAEPGEPVVYEEKPH